MTLPTELLLLIFLHGFKGGNDTFASFPNRIQHILTESQTSTDVQCIVYPPYDTRGELVVAVENHISWLSSIVVEREALYKEKGGTGPCRVVLLGHSMGGLVITDSALAISSTSNPWPNIIGVISFDSPLYGLNPKVFSNTISKAADYIATGHSVLTTLGVGLGAWSTFNKKADVVPESSNNNKSTSTVATTSESNTTSTPSSWLFKSALAIGGAALVGTAGAAYLKRDDISTHINWATSHLSFIGELFSSEALENRMKKVERNMRFHCFYTLLPPTKSQPSTPRTFIIVPQISSPLSKSFTPNTNNKATDEIEAHTEMFTEKSDGLYALGSQTCRILSDWLEEVRIDERKGKGKSFVDDVRLV